MAMLIDVAGDFIWNLLRFGAFLMVVPIFGNQLIPGRVRLLLAVGVSFALTPVAGGAPPMEQWGLDSMGMLVTQMAMGVGLGFAAVIFFHLFVIAGQFIGMQMGLGFAAMVDPGNGIQVTVWSQFFLMLVTLSFLSLNGHLVLLEVLTHGYRLYPQMSTFSVSELLWRVGTLGGWMFVGGVLLALPAVISLLIVNLAFGVMNRSAPALNVFSLGFPFSLLFRLLIIGFLLTNWGDQFLRLKTEFLEITDNFFVADAPMVGNIR